MELLGVRIAGLTRSQLTARVAEVIERGPQRSVVAHHNLHSAALCRKDAKLRQFYEQAAYVHADGMSLVALAWLLGLPLKSSHRTTYVEWFPELLAAAQQRQWRVFYLGSSPESLVLGLRQIRSAYPGLQIDGADGYFGVSAGSAANKERLEAINEFRPDILFVGMGMPRQERWTAENRGNIDAKVILMTGACLDYVSATIPTPPRWSGRLGLEWIFRLAAEPRRLAFRYLLEPWLLFPEFVRDLTRHRDRHR